MYNGLDFWGDSECTLLDNDKTLWHGEATNPRALFVAAWERVREEWATNVRPLTIRLEVGNRAGEGTVLTVRTAANGRGPAVRCECPTCGWDEARLFERQVVMADDFGLLYESPIEWLTANESTKLCAMWREVECTMCTELDLAGLDRVTKRPSVTAGLRF